MFPRAGTRKKDAKQHRYWSIVENRRLAGGRVLQRHVLYLGGINGSQQRAWRKSVEVFDEREHMLAALCMESSELGYEMLWQGEPDLENNKAGSQV
jgi:hypothetical protein